AAMRSTALLLVAAITLASCSGDDSAEPSTSPPTPTAQAPATPADTSTATTAASTMPPASTPATTTGAPTSAATTEPPSGVAPEVTEDRAYYVLPPGNYGGLPVNDDSLDQLALYDGLTPL